jgi:hypothetical protein
MIPLLQAAGTRSTQLPSGSPTVRRVHLAAQLLPLAVAPVSLNDADAPTSSTHAACLSQDNAAMAGRGLASCGHFALNCSAESRNRSTGVSVADSPTWDMLPQLPSPRYQYRPNSGMAAQDRCPIPIYAIRLPKEPEGVLRYVHRPPFFFLPPPFTCRQ